MVFCPPLSLFGKVAVELFLPIYAHFMWRGPLSEVPAHEVDRIAGEDEVGIPEVNVRTLGIVPPNQPIDRTDEFGVSSHA